MLQRTNSTAERKGLAPNPAFNRSAVTNGRSLFVEAVDGRLPWARRFRDLIELHLSDLGGRDVCSEGQCSLVRRIAAIEVELERMEGQFAQKPATPDKLDLYQRMSNTLRRLLDAIGLERKARDVYVGRAGDLEEFL